ncbi:unnamed protein product [Brassica napus]|uniref:(rape) hypothetical protein n=1 Tax=Brassica napus TaxID=3708 RepID=A0A816KVG1_BRANA|nr:unnamed protein product [Brassica napus]
MPSQQLSLKGCFARDTAKAHAKTSMIAGEGVSNIRTVAAFNAQSKILSVFCHELRVPQKKKLSNLRLPLWSLPACSLRFRGSNPLLRRPPCEPRQVNLLQSDQKSLFVVLVITANSVAETVILLAPEIIRGGEAVGSVFPVLDMQTGIEPDDAHLYPIYSINIPVSCSRGDIEFRHVGFA